MAFNPFDLTGRVALVTGANTGLGQGLAVALARAGADIVAAGRSTPTETETAVTEVGARFHFVHADLDSVGVVQQVVDQAVAAFGRIDILVNNAGTIRRADALEFSEDDWDLVMNVNLKTPFFLAQAAARQMVAQGAQGKGGGGKIINIASMLSFQGGIRVASYTASKSGIAGLTKLLANEWAAKGINVNAIAPGYFATNNTEALRNDETRNRDILARIPAGRWGRPEDLGGAAVFLSSSAADYVHGTVLAVDGGWLGR
ncbi:2-dehydro-3-deoxy-D-gluconate 5-dehydrogenase KduD [Nitrospirillum sp. BR 11164]|uniref:2-dehydro-3-deoxy-D-gluconate 5-dehydrogenase KduD n=1 Tax=Nitrospirillum sp. BR 11164 TaxID=3104324 RepID=UPI002AFE936E|nr:2-dehydro-3-deoxy-D-gluconate 5-dehydrogenase KduD [Nitrospirillum sp. BR 11164]MEA1650777.1 2-dehydro-3-deoxy-D-gluconate 5-dehydrogenase KduD [Nitrospirillum sp. BR 11164]